MNKKTPEKEKPDPVVVVGDVKSTLAVSLAGKSKGHFRIPLWDGKTATRSISVLRRWF